MAQKISQGNIFGRIGSGIGKGLAEQLPKEIANNRLASGLESLEKGDSNLTPIQQFAALKRAGASDQDIATTMPLLELGNANKAAKQQAINENLQLGSGQNPSYKSPMANQQQPQGQGQGQQPRGVSQDNRAPQETKPSIITQAPEQASLNPILPLTAAQARSQGVELHQKYPGKYRTVDEGTQAAISDNNSKIAEQEAIIAQGASQKALRQTLENETAKKMGINLEGQGGGIESAFKDKEGNSEVPGEYISRVLDEQDSAVASGKKTTQQAAADAAKDILDYAELRAKNKSLGGKSWWSINPRDARSGINSQRAGYKKRGELNTFVDDLVENQDLSRARASYIAFPINENKDLNNYLSKEKKLPIVPGTGYAELPIKKAEQIADNLNKYITDKDSLLSIAAELQGKNIDAGVFLDKVQQKYENGEISLSKRQRDELDDRGPMDLTMGDWWLFETAKLGALPEVE